MSNEDIKHIKSYLRDYRFYQRKLEECERKIEQIEYELQGVKGVSFDHEGAVESYHSGAKPDRFHELMEELDRVQENKAEASHHIEEIKKICETAEDSYIMTEVFLKGRTYDSLANELSEKDGTIWYFQLIDSRIRRAIRQYLLSFKQ